MMIRMAHGSGGRETELLINTVFLKHINNDYLRKMEDAAVIGLNGKTAFTTDSYVVAPLFFKGGDIGRLSISGTVNDLLMMGAVPKYISAGFIIEEGMDSETLEKIVASMADTAMEAGILIVAADTKVIEGKGGLFINTSGIGEIPAERDISVHNCVPGDAIIVSGNLGDHHACILSARMGIQNEIASDAAPLNTIVDALFQSGANVKAMRDLTRGGLATILNEICTASGTGACVYEKQIPISEQTRALCEILGIDPLYMGNEGKFVAIVDKDDADKALSALRQAGKGKNASIIGNICDDKRVTLMTGIGGKRVVHPLLGEGLPRIC
jgi:hydrogenase expression/formation protein HypE